MNRLLIIPTTGFLQSDYKMKFTIAVHGGAGTILKTGYDA